jgi:DNA-binding CsgD family transcriptional regulator
MSRVLTIPLAVGPQGVCTLALLRAAPDFAARDLELARQLQPVLSGLYALRDRDRGPALSAPCTDIGIQLTARELAVLNLMASGLIATAIGRELGISARTVSKHIENIYRKLGTHDRTSAVLRGQDLGIMRPGAQAQRVKPSAPTVTSAGCFSGSTGRGRPSRSRTGVASVYQDGITGWPQKSRRRGSRTDQRSTGWPGSPVK